MPKERVLDVAGMFDVQVGWQRDRWVQLAVVTTDGKPLSEVVTSWKQDDGQGHVNDAGEYERSDGIWSTLDRQQINDLIRKLRKARDQAFGADA